LVLEDGSVVEGEAFGHPGTAYGELVFTTGMTGYQESLTDPSYAGQILLLTYPLVGNYGVNADDFESGRIWPRGFVVREACPTPSHRKGQKDIDAFLRDFGVPGIAGVDTRALTLATRDRGTLKACLTTEDAPDEELLAKVRGMPHPDSENLVGKASVPKPVEVPGKGSRRIVLLDCGAKENIVRSLAEFGTVHRVPWDTSAAKVLGYDPDGVFLSNGPGDPSHPEVLRHTVQALRDLRAQAPALPTMGICLGHQMVGLSFGARTFKLKFGHRGANQPVKDLETGRVYITSQNHGYAVDVESAKAHGLLVSQVNGNDGTSEGFRHASLPIRSVQYHPEAHPGPRDTWHLFEEFSKMMQAAPPRAGAGASPAAKGGR
jgi:carbamoyl-phosphate synthase small subunit